MKDIHRRLKKAEKTMNINQEHTTVNIVWYGDKLPPDRTEGNITCHYVEKENNEQRKEKG